MSSRGLKEARLAMPPKGNSVEDTIKHNKSMMCSRLKEITMIDADERTEALRYNKKHIRSQDSHHSVSSFNITGRFRFEKSSIHRYGLITSERLKNQETLLEVVGPMLRPSVAEARYQRYKNQNHQIFYIVQVDDNNYLDLTYTKTVARYLNHNCEPNCQFRLSPSKTTAILFAKRDILPYEELTIDYGINSIPRNEKIICNCGNPKCRGFINWREAPDDRFRNIPPMQVQFLASQGIINPITTTRTKPKELEPKPTKPSKEEKKQKKEEKEKRKLEEKLKQKLQKEEKQQKASKEEKTVKTPINMESAAAEIIQMNLLSRQNPTQFQIKKAIKAQLEIEKNLERFQQNLRQDEVTKTPSKQTKQDDAPKSTPKSNKQEEPAKEDKRKIKSVEKRSKPVIMSSEYNFSSDARYVPDLNNEHIKLRPPAYTDTTQWPDQYVLDNFIRTVHNID